MMMRIGHIPDPLIIIVLDYTGQPAATVRDVDEGQASTGALPDQGHRHHEQRLAAVHPRQPESSGPLHLHALQRAGHAGLLGYELASENCNSLNIKKYVQLFFFLIESSKNTAKGCLSSISYTLH